MKWIVKAAMGAVLCLFATGDARPDIVTTGLVGHLDAESAPVGSQWPALVGANAELFLGVAYHSDGVARYAFDGLDDWARIQPAPMNDANINDGYTLEAWVRPNTDSGIQVIAGFDRIDNSGNPNQTGFRANGSDWQMYRANAGDFASGAIATGDVAVGDWTHVTATWDGTQFTGYINGEQQDQWTTTVNVDSIERIMVGGKKTFTNSIHQYLDGDIAQLRIYEDPLQPTDVVQNFSSSLHQLSEIPSQYASTGLKVYLDARNILNTDQTWENLVAGGNDATMTQSSLTTGDPDEVAHYRFDGANSRGQIAGNPLGTVAEINDGFTLEFWVRPQENSPGVQNFQALADFDDTVGGDSGSEVGLRISDGSPPTNTLDYYAYRSDPTNGFDRFKVIDESPEIPLGQWAHMVLTWDGAQFSGYKNGQLQLTEAADLDLVDIDTFMLGARHRNNGGSDFYDMLLDSDLALVRAYDRVLSDAEIVGNFRLDAAYFGVPEPATSLLAILGLGAVLLGPARARRRRTYSS